MARQKFSLTCSLLLAAACGPVSEADFEDDVESTASALGTWGEYDSYFGDDSCPNCSKNAATVGDGVVFDQLNMDGSNGKGITVIGAKLCSNPITDLDTSCGSSEPVHVTVPNNRILAQRYVGGLPADEVPAADLLGRLIITIESECRATYELLVQREQPVSYLVDLPAPLPQLPEYEFGYRKTGGCGGPSLVQVSGGSGAGSTGIGSGGATDFAGIVAGGGQGSQGSAGYVETTTSTTGQPSTNLHFDPVCPVEDAMIGPRSRLAIVYSGDNIDSDLKTVKNRSSIRWFNLACNGTALAKLHFLRHTRRVGGKFQTAADRQTILKMLTADYCGTGTSYTVNGHPLRYWDGAHGLGGTTFPTLTDTERDQVEAVWTPDGAACLNNPRHVQRSEVPCAQPDGLPRCDEAVMATELAKRHAVVSAHRRQILKISRGPIERKVLVTPLR